MKHKRLGRPKGSKDKKFRKRRNVKMGNKSRAKKSTKITKVIKRAISHKPVELNKATKEHKKGYIPQVFPYVKSYKFLGYCKCNTIISTKDLISKLIYFCPICSKRARIKTLRKTLNIDRIDKKEEKEEIHHHIDMLPLNDHIIDPKDFKVQE